MRGRTAFLGLLAVCAITFSGLAQASWPTARHDSRRSGAASGTSDITTPVAYWRTYLGGALASGQLLATDVNGDSKTDAILVSGGTVVAKSSADQTYWKTPPLGILGLVDIADLDGDGKLDIVAYSSDHAYIFAAATGAIEWAEPDGEMGSLGTLRVGDVTGDGKPDMVVTECGCCGVNSGKSGFVWTFGSGFGSAQSLGSLQVFGCGTSATVTLGNADGTGGLEILLADYNHFALLKSDGSVLAQTGDQGTRVSENNCIAQNLDGVPGDEFVCILNSGDPPSTNQRKITVLQYNSQTTSLNVLWSKVVAPDAGGNMAWVDPVADLDGDGKYEIVVSTQDTSGWQTRLFDALDGSEFTPAIGAGQIIQGTASSEVAGKRLILTATGTTLAAWNFVRSPFSVTQRWQITGETVMTYGRANLLAKGGIGRAALVIDLNGDGLDEIITRSSAQPTAISAYAGAGGTAKKVASYTLPVGLDPQSAWLLPGITSAVKQQVGLVTTDGILSFLDSSLQPAADPANPTKPIAIEVGGYYASGGWREMAHAPRTYALDGTKNESILVPDSRRSLLRFDGASASWAIPPPPSWSASDTFTATIVDKLDGNKPGAACIALQQPVTDPPSYRLRALRGDGSVLWDVAMASNPTTDLAPGDFNGDGVPDFAVQWAAPSDANLVTRAVSGTNGATLWETAPLPAGGGGVAPAGISVGKFGSSPVDIFFQAGATHVLDGATGTQAALGGNANSYSLPMLVDLSGTGVNSVLLTSGYWPVQLFSSDLQTAVWTSSDDDRPYPYGATAQCGAVPTLVQGSWQNPARLKMTPLSGTTLGQFTTVVLAGGKLYANESAAKSGGAFLGQLTSANVDSNLTGKGHPTAVVGSSDGWLYGVNPCGGTLDFALNVGAAVGEAVFGDTDGDGRDEIIVTAADGFLYDIKNEAIAKPAYVWDTDPDHGITDHDVSTIDTVDKLSGAWAPVTGATGYEVTVVTKDGTPIPKPVWKNVGTATSASLSGLALTVGTEYFFAVRALSAKGPSVDTLSDGVTVAAGGSDGGVDAAPDGGTVAGGGGGCGCEVVPSSSSLLGFIATLLAVMFAAARRRRA